MYEGIYTRHKSRGFWDRLRRLLWQYHLSIVGLTFLTFIMFVAFAPALFAPYDYVTQFDVVNQPAIWAESGTDKHILGTDDLGRDILSRLIYGTRYSVGYALLVTLFATSTGLFIGTLSSISRSWLDTLIMSFLELLNALPSLVLAIAIVAIVGAGLTNTVLAVALVAIPNIALQIRADIKAELNKPYTSFAQMDGANNLQIVTREVLPNVGAKLLAQSGNVFSVAILEISALGFLGLGAQAPLPEWGTLLAEAHLQFFTNAYSIFMPGAAILLSVLSINWVSAGLNDAINALKET